MREHGKRRGIYLLPNLLTTCNIMLGFFALTLAYQGRFELSAFAIIVAWIFDILDGRVARAMGSGSPFGVEYDSLADLISFGLAPAFLMYGWTLQHLGRVGWAVACLYVICVALRLARYNTHQHEAPNEKDILFQGMPSPGGAGMITTTVLFEVKYGLIGSAMPMVALGLMIFLSFLLISQLPYGRGASHEPRPFLNLVSGVLILIAVAAEPHLVLFLIGIVYTSTGLVRGFIYRHREGVASGTVSGH